MTGGDDVVASLDVWLGADRCGRLDHVGNARMRFAYSDDHTGPALSASLPVRAEPYEHAACTPFFEGLLPEAGVRDLVERQLHVSRRNDFALLAAIGGDCAGAVSLWPRDALPEVRERGVQWLTDEELAARLVELPSRPIVRDEAGRIRLSLAGAQDKLVAVVDGERVGVPLGDQPSTHILKVDPAAFEDLVVAEAFCLRLAARCGLRTAEAALREIGGRTVLIVERFDRDVGEDVALAQRVHQEDLCQALGISSRTKYEAEGGPSIRDCAGLIRREARVTAPSLLAFAQLVGFNELIGNADAHGKNYSLLHRPGAGVELAPAYDLVSTHAFEGLDERFAMAIGGRRAPELRREHWDGFARDAGLGPAATRRMLRDQAVEVPGAAHEVADAFGAEGWRRPIVEHVLGVIDRRAAARLAALG